MADTEAFEKWLGLQPPDMEYTFTDPECCVLAEFLGDQCLLEDEVAILGKGGRYIISSHPRTYGACLERLRRALREGAT